MKHILKKISKAGRGSYDSRTCIHSAIFKATNKARHTHKQFQFFINFYGELLINPRFQQQQYCSDMTDWLLTGWWKGLDHVGGERGWTKCTTSVQHLALVYTQHWTVKLVNNCNIQTFFLLCSAIILTIAESHTRKTCFYHLPVYHELFNLLCHSWFN